jgi:hypothetical protein
VKCAINYVGNNFNILWISTLSFSAGALVLNKVFSPWNMAIISLRQLQEQWCANPGHEVTMVVIFGYGTLCIFNM